jgi:hypothetical protein
MQKVTELIKDIKSNLTQTASSSKDEEAVMRAMLNDKSYTVGVYSKEGKIGEVCPAEMARDLAANIIHGAVKVSKDEAIALADGYVFKKDDSLKMIGISKEFVNTFVQSGRKLPLGGREKMNAAVSLKEVAKSKATYPKKVGVNADGSGRFESGEVDVPAHESLRVESRCPSWIQVKSK